MSNWCFVNTTYSLKQVTAETKLLTSVLNLERQFTMLLRLYEIILLYKSSNKITTPYYVEFFTNITLR